MKLPNIKISVGGTTCDVRRAPEGGYLARMGFDDAGGCADCVEIVAGSLPALYAALRVTQRAHLAEMERLRRGDGGSGWWDDLGEIPF